MSCLEEQDLWAGLGSGGWHDGGGGLGWTHLGKASFPSGRGVRGEQRAASLLQGKLLAGQASFGLTFLWSARFQRVRLESGRAGAEKGLVLQRSQGVSRLPTCLRPAPSSVSHCCVCLSPASLCPGQKIHLRDSLGESNFRPDLWSSFLSASLLSLVAGRRLDRPPRFPFPVCGLSLEFSVACQAAGS